MARLVQRSSRHAFTKTANERSKQRVDDAYSDCERFSRTPKSEENNFDSTESILEDDDDVAEYLPPNREPSENDYYKDYENIDVMPAKQKSTTAKATSDIHSSRLYNMPAPRSDVLKGYVSEIRKRRIAGRDGDSGVPTNIERKRRFIGEKRDNNSGPTSKSRKPFADSDSDDELFVPPRVPPPPASLTSSYTPYESKRIRPVEISTSAAVRNSRGVQRHRSRPDFRDKNTEDIIMKVTKPQTSSNRGTSEVHKRSITPYAKSSMSHAKSTTSFAVSSTGITEMARRAGLNFEASSNASTTPRRVAFSSDTDASWNWRQLSKETFHPRTDRVNFLVGGSNVYVYVVSPVLWGYLRTGRVYQDKSGKYAMEMTLEDKPQADRLATFVIDSQSE